MWRCFEKTGRVPPDRLFELGNIEQRDSVFPNIDPQYWAPR